MVLRPRSIFRGDIARPRTSGCGRIFGSIQRRCAKAVAAAALLLLGVGGSMAASIAPSAGIDMEAGLWVLTTRVERNGVVSMRPTRTRCVGPAAADAARMRSSLDFAENAVASLNAQFGKDACRLAAPGSASEPAPGIMNWRLTCSGPATLEQEGTARFADRRHYRVVVTTRITVLDRTARSVTTIEGRHVGACRR